MRVGISLEGYMAEALEPGQVTPEQPAPGQEIPAASETAASVPEKTFTQAELNQAVERRLAKERGRMYRKVGALEQELEQLKTVKHTPPPEGAPKREQFDSYEDFLEAKAEWKAEQAVEKRLAKQHEENAKKAHLERQRELNDNWESRKDKGRDKYADFDSVVGADDVVLTEAMMHAVMESDAGHEIAYHLGKNPDEAERISKLSPVRQIAEMAKLEMQLAITRPPISKAPDPINPVGGHSVSNNLPSDKDDINTWVAKERERLAAKRKGRA